MTLFNEVNNYIASPIVSNLKHLTLYTNLSIRRSMCCQVTPAIGHRGLKASQDGGATINEGRLFPS